MSSLPPRPTTPDLVLLSLLTEKPQHGYELNAELERRAVEDWAGVSRPQVYYSLHKLAGQGWIAATAAEGNGAGPERQVYAITPAGRAALANGLSHPSWADQRTLPAFVTWLALSAHATPDAKATVVAARQVYLEAQLEREREHLADIDTEAGEMAPIARLMIALKIAQFEQELAWLDEVRRTLLG